jgi:hypothetical protein
MPIVNGQMTESSKKIEKLRKRDRLQWSEISFSIKGYKDSKSYEKVRSSENKL